MNGGPIDLTPFGSVLTGLGIFYWLVAAGALVAALKIPKTRRGKSVAALVVVAAFGYMPASIGWQAFQARGQLNESMAHFDMQCKNAGEKINRTVENVDGVVWMKWREPISNADNFADQFKLNDPYGQDCGGDVCIKALLRATTGLEIDPKKASPFRKGYAFVESTDPRDGRYYRYTMRLAEGGLDNQVLERRPIEKPSARYGVTWDDISTREDRQHWIAGGSLKVVDLQTNEVIAQRVGYMVDRGQGSQEGFRSPWLYAEYTACPPFDRSESNTPTKTSRSRNFVRKILKPIQEEQS